MGTRIQKSSPSPAPARGASNVSGGDAPAANDRPKKLDKGGDSTPTKDARRGANSTGEPPARSDGYKHSTITITNDDIHNAVDAINDSKIGRPATPADEPPPRSSGYDHRYIEITQSMIDAAVAAIAEAAADHAS